MLADDRLERKEIEQKRDARKRAAASVARTVRALNEGASQRECSELFATPKSSIHEQQTRFYDLEISLGVYEFLSSLEGMMILQRVVDAMLLFVHKAAGVGLRVIEDVLRASGLDRFIAASPSALGQRATTMEKIIFEYHTYPENDRFI